MSRRPEPMSPDDSPDAIPKKIGVRRVNNVPLLLIGAVLLAFAVMIGLVAADRTSKQQTNANDQSPSEDGGNTEMLAKEIAGSQTSGFIPPAEPAPPEPPPDKPVVVTRPKEPPTPDDRDRPPLPPPGNRPSFSPGRDTMTDSEASRIRMDRMRALEEAVKSPTGVQTDGAGGGGGDMGGMRHGARSLRGIDRQIAQLDSSDPKAEYMKQLAFAQKLAQSGDGGGAGALATSRNTDTGDGSGNNLSRFQSNDPDRWRLKSTPQKPDTPYELRAGFVIPALLISGINSELPGQIMAQVTQSVYDTPTGKYLLIPQGSRLIGAYSSEIIFGQARVFVGWQRIIFPDGKAMDIGAMPGGDGAGYAGFTDKVNNHYMRLFGSAFMMSVVTAGVAMSQNRGANDERRNQRAGDAMSEALGQQLGQVTAQLIAKNMNIAPTLEIRPGYRFNIIVTKDMAFKKLYEDFDY